LFRGRQTLAVLARDVRSESQRSQGRPSDSIVGTAGGTNTVSGILEPLPHAEAMFIWNLTDRQRRELAERPYYIRIDRLAPNTRD
jgi:hypothetical protein